MTNEQKIALMDRLKPILGEFGVTGFTGLLFSLETFMPEYGDTGELVTYSHPDCLDDTKLVLRHYYQVLENEWQQSQIDLAALWENAAGTYLVTINLNEQEAWEMYGMVTSANANVVPDQLAGLSSAFKKIRDCLIKQLPKDDMVEADKALQIIADSFNTPPVERGMLQGGILGLAERAIDRLNQSSNENS